MKSAIGAQSGHVGKCDTSQVVQGLEFRKKERKKQSDE